MRPLRRDPIFLGLALMASAVGVYLVRHASPLYWVDWVRLDEGYRLYPSLRLLRGESLFDGMFTPYPPLSYHLHGLAYQLLGVRVSSVRIVLAVSQVATTLLAYALARRLVRRGFALYAALLTLLYGVVQLNMGYSAWYVVPLGLGAALLLCRHAQAERPALGPLFGAGLLVGLALATKHRDGTWLAVAAALAIVALRLLRDFPPGRGRAGHPLYAAHLLLPCGIAVLLGKHLDLHRAVLLLLPAAALSGALLLRQLAGSGPGRPRPGALLRELAALGAGIAGVNLPWIAYYGAGPGLPAIWSQLVVIPRAMQERLVDWGVLAPMTEAYAAAALVLVLATAALFAPRRMRAVLPWLLAAGFVSLPAVALGWPTLFGPGRFVLLPLASLLALLYLARSGTGPDAVSPPDRRALLVLTVFNCAVPVTLFPSTDFPHWLWACGFSFPLACFLADRAQRQLARRDRRLGWIPGVALALLLVAMLPPSVDPRRERRPRVDLGGPAADVRVDARSAEAVQPVLDFIASHVPEDGHLLELPSGFFTFLSQRRQAAQLDYFYGLDGSLWDQRRELRHIRERSPRYAIVPTPDPAWLSWRRSFPVLDAYLRRAYAPLRRFGNVAILVRRGPGGPAGPAGGSGRPGAGRPAQERSGRDG